MKNKEHLSLEPIGPNVHKATSGKCSQKYLVSACLAGVPCRYDGTTCLIDAIALLVKDGAALPFCPETAGGLLTPRAPSEICDNKVINSISEDVTEQHLLGAKKTLAFMQANNLKIAILKDFSPSCGSSMIYDGTFTKTLIPGEGITTIHLRANGITVCSAEDYLMGKNIS